MVICVVTLASRATAGASRLTCVSVSVRFALPGCHLSAGRVSRGYVGSLDGCMTPLESRFCQRLVAGSLCVSVSSVVFAQVSSAVGWRQVSAGLPGRTSSCRLTSARVVDYPEHLHGSHQASWIWSQLVSERRQVTFGVHRHQLVACHCQIGALLPLQIFQYLG